MSAGVVQLADVSELRAHGTYPAVSVLAPVQRRRPGNAEDPILLRDLVDEAARRVRAELGTRAGSEILERLDEAVATVDWRSPAESVAIFVAPGESRVLELPFTVRARVAIDQTFATRDLVRGIARNPRYRLLALGEQPSRLFGGQGSVLAECHSGGFPCSRERVRGEPHSSRDYPMRNSRDEEQQRMFFREVDRALGAVGEGDPLPLLVAGTERDLASFDEVTRHAARIVGRIEGNYEEAIPTDLVVRAAPLIDAYAASQRAAIVGELVEAVGSGRGLVGVKAAWEAARAGRARVLLVEDDFVYPAREVDGGLEPAGDAAAPGVIDDAVDELVEMVLSAGGEVVILDAGELGEHGPAALLLRY
ncbi:MAG: hypothetical protein ACHQDE_03455 [Acidimicrobiia bacterium]